MLWNPVHGLARIDQSPDDGLEVGWEEIVGFLVYAFLHKEVTTLLPVPNDWLLFGQAST
jgi:hypothetical protein